MQEEATVEERRFGPVWFIPGERNGKYPYCHSLYIEDKGILVDPSSDRARLTRLREDPGIKAVWLSHWHEDHLMHLDLFDDLPLWTSEEDAPPLSDLETFLDWYGMDVNDGPFRKEFGQSMEDQFHFRPRKPDRFLKGGEILEVGSVTVEVIAAPGHTPGNLALFFKEPGVLFLGDYDLTPFGPWYGDVYSSVEETLVSLEHLRRIPARVWITGHEQGVFEEDPGELWDKYVNVIWEREQRLLELLSQPRGKQDIIEAWIVYGKPREPRYFFEFGEWGIMEKHLDRLTRQGLVEQVEGRYVRGEGS
jgi:glyoxylase-like metal-dependent hydrolase (beta-lactamase superfamily II)